MKVNLLKMGEYTTWSMDIEKNQIHVHYICGSEDEDEWAPPFFRARFPGRAG